MAAIYFISDIHLGLQDEGEERRKLEGLRRLFAALREGDSLYMLGDVFDYWMEFRHVIPKGFTGFFCLLLELSNRGVRVTYLPGNHDFYLGSFFDRELGVRTIDTVDGPLSFEFEGRRFIVAHGDGLGEGDGGYKFFARFVRNRFNLGLLTGFHPDLAVGLMKWLSRLSRTHKPQSRVMETDRLLEYALSLERQQEFDYFLCGHNHSGGLKELKRKGSYYVNLGSWIEGGTPYGVFEDGIFQLKES